MKTVDRISQVLNTVVKHMAGLLTGAMAILVFLQVVFRYLLEAPIDWSEEMSTFAFAWMTLLGASVGLRNNKHPRLDILLVHFPNILQKLARGLINSASMFMLVVLLIYGVKYTMAMKMQNTAALGYPVSWIYLVLPISALIMLVHVFAQSIMLFKKEPRGD